MSSAKHAATHIGRVGALAVALGIGAAMASGTAWADPADPSDTSETGTTGRNSGQSASSDSTSTSAGPTRRGTRASNPARSTRTAPPRPAAAERPVNNDSPVDEAPVAKAAPSAVKPLAPAEPQQISPPAPAARVSPAASVPPVTVPAPTASLKSAPVPAAVVAPTALPTVVPVAVTEVPVAVAAPKATLAAPRLASRLLSAVGLAPIAGNTVPGVVDSPALWALLGWTRRDAGRTGVRTAAAQSALPSATVATAVVTTPTSLPSTPLGWVTGQRNTAFPGLTWPQTNNTRWANIYGTDLGIMWFNGVNGKTQLAFGDTFSQPNMTGDWRSNVLLLSDDTNLTDGLSLLNTGPAFQFIPAARGEVFFIGSEVTNIPTSAIYANNNNYVNYMSVKSWDSPGRWTTNYSAISQYDPATDKWVLQRSTIRPAGVFRAQKAYSAGDQNFQQMAYVLQPESKVVAGEPRYVYAFGTPAGRAGSAYLSRVPEGELTNLRKYEYWNGNRWVGDQARAEAIIGDSPNSPGLIGWAIDLANNPNFFGGYMAGFTGAKTGGNVSEMSVQYNEYLDKYVVLYGNGANNVILRTADTPEGPWSDPITIATSVQYPGLYAPMIHPLSGTGELSDGNGDPDISNLYWNMSIWSNYNVVLMQTDLAPLAVTPV
jgi:hypothetical protein